METIRNRTTRVYKQFYDKTYLWRIFVPFHIKPNHCYFQVFLIELNFSFPNATHLSRSSYNIS